MYARDIMTSPVFTVAPGETVARARNLMIRYRISRLLVMDGEDLTGIITKKDIAYRMRQAEPAWRRRPLDRIPVGALATADPVSIGPDTKVKEIVRLFVRRLFSSAPVSVSGRVGGIVTKTDLMKSALVRDLEGSAGDVMEDIPVVNRYHSLAHVVGVMQERSEKVLVCTESGAPLGIITETNLAFYENEQGLSGVVGKDVTITRRETVLGRSGQGLLPVAPVTAEDVMTSPVITMPPSASLREVIAMMERHHVNSVVVMETGGNVAGIVKRDDIIKEVAK